MKERKSWSTGAYGAHNFEDLNMTSGIGLNSF